MPSPPSLAHAPRSLAELGGAPPLAPELEQLLSLHQAGFALAPLRVVPAAAEESFYRLNNLPERLRELFAAVDASNPDEDEVEEVAPAARELIMAHYLLDEFIDLFYQALEPLPAKLHLRRAGAPGLWVLKGRPALVALKELWAADWQFEAVMARLERRASVALEARPVLLGPAEEEAADQELAARVRAFLGSRVPVFTQADGAITRLVGP